MHPNFMQQHPQRFPLTNVVCKQCGFAVIHKAFGISRNFSFVLRVLAHERGGGFIQPDFAFQQTFFAKPFFKLLLKCLYIQTLHWRTA